MDLPGLVAAASDRRTPEDERYDLNREVFQQHLWELTHTPENFAALNQEMHVLGKSLSEQQYAGLEPLKRTLPVHDKTGKRVSALHVSELGVLSPWPGTRWIEKPDYMGFQALQWMCDHVFLFNAITNTRVRQGQSFARWYRERSEYPYGMQLRRRDGQRLSLDDRKEVEWLQRWIDNCGDEFEPWKRRKLGRDSFPTFLGKIIRGTLNLDACPIEVELKANGRPAGIYAIPPDTVRLCSEDGYEGDDSIVGLQLYETRVTTLYEGPQLIYEIRNPRSHMLAGGYGYAESEMSIRIATALLNAFTYNAAGFDRNQIPRGILQVFGNYKDEELEMFKRQWNSLMTGPAQRWRLPVLASTMREAGANYTQIDQQFNEMHFAKWLSFLTSIVCGLYGMSPEEINLDSFSSKQGGLSTAGQDTAERLASSKDKGLEPLLSFLERTLNEWVLWRLGLGDKYVLVFRGLHPISPELQWQQTVALQTRDEARADRDMEPCENPEIGEAPLDPGGSQIYSQGLMMASMGGPMMGQPGPGGGGGGGGGQQPLLPDYVKQRLNGPDSAENNPVSRGGDQAGQSQRGADKVRQAHEAVKSRRVLIVEAA